MNIYGQVLDYVHKPQRISAADGFFGMDPC